MKLLTRLGHGLTHSLAGALHCVAAATAAHAGPFSSMVVFGDSLSDSGNNAIAIGIDPTQVITGNSYVPTFAYASGTYSNGDVWATMLADRLGLSIGPSLAGGTNYAYGGAVTRSDAPFPPSLRNQVTDYLSNGPAVDPNGLYVIAGGGNNVRDALDAIAGGAPIGATLIGTALRYAVDVGTMVDQLQAAGAQNIVVWNAPNVGFAPAVTAEGSLASLLGTTTASVMNAALNQRLAGEQGVTTFDVFGLFGVVAADPASFGLSNITDACGQFGAACDPSSFLFWDGLHLTSGGNAIVADAMFAAVIPEPGTWALLAVGLVVVGAAARRRTAV
jgi:outer membrane lipase/esterase